MKFSSVLTFLVLTITSVIGQNYELDALKFSTNNFSGTARFMSVGGAFSSVGADFSNASYNPAGIGMFRSSIIVGGLSFGNANTSSSYFGNTQTDNNFRINLGSAGAIFSQSNFKNLKGGMIQSAAFGIGINRMSNFNSNEQYSAFNGFSGSSITNIWVNEISAVNGQQEGTVDENNFSFEAVNGYQTFLVNFDTSLLTFTTPITNGVTQSRTVENRGGKNEIVLSGGANYLDKLYFGASLGIPIVNYERNIRYSEEDTENLNGSFNSFDWEYNYDITGLGFNFKTGIIYRPKDWIRIGGAIQTPERLSLTEEYSSSIQSEFDLVAYEHLSPIGEFDYILRLPWRANAGVSFFYKKNGFISFDYEVVDYNSIRYNFEQEFSGIENDINDNIRDRYKTAHNLRVGIEGVIQKVRLRAGYNYIGSPFEKNTVPDYFNFSNHRISGGFGLLFEKIAVDVGAMYAFTNEIEQPFTLPNNTIDAVERERNNLAINITVAYRIR